MKIICGYCGTASPTILKGLLHNFTDHLGVDVGLPPKDAVEVLEEGQQDMMEVEIEVGKN